MDAVSVSENDDPLDSTTCPICLEAYNGDVDERQARFLPCGHTFCTRCLVELVKESYATMPERPVNCPACRGRFPVPFVSLLPRNYAIEAMVGVIHRLLSRCVCRLGGGPPSPPADEGASPAEEEAPPDALPPFTPCAPVIRLPAPGVPPHAVMSAVLSAVRSAGRPLPINRVCQVLEEQRLWPPTGLAELVAARERGAGRDVTATGLSATSLSKPTQAVLKAFVLGRVQANGGGSAGLHVEVSKRIISECFCVGGPGCSLVGGVALFAPALPGGGGWRGAPPMRHSGSPRAGGGSAARPQPPPRRPEGEEEEDDGYGEQDDRWDSYEDHIIMAGRRGGRR